VRARCAGAALALLVSVAAGASADQGEGAHSLEQVMDCFVKGIPPSAHGRFALTHVHQGVSEHTASGQYWAELPETGARKVLIASPDAWDGKAGAYLFSEGDALGEAWAWKHGDPKPARVQAHSPEAFVFHTDVSFEDFARFARIVAPGQIRRLPDTSIGGRYVFVLETRPGPDARSIYDRVITSIDKEWCTPLRREGYSPAFEKGERPVRVVTIDPQDVKVEKGFARVQRALLEDNSDGSKTIVKLEDLELGEKLPDAFFTPENLPKALSDRSR
jgi:hypothetical protein